MIKELIQVRNETQSPAEMRSKIVQLEAAMMSIPEHHIEIPIKHYFSPGIYMREMTMPKGSTVMGKIHKTEHMCILAKGSVAVVNENGTNHYQAPCVVHSMPGIKRALHAIEETVWINVHHNPTNETDVDKIDDVFVVETYEQFLDFVEHKQIEEIKVCLS